MKELIKITESEGGKQVVSARDLHTFLEVKDHFTQWSERMFEYGFTQNIDYQAINQFVTASNGVGGTNKIDYVLTLDCAKNIGMLQRSEKGKEIRQYFIECEKKLLTPKVMSIEESIIYSMQSIIEIKKEQEITKSRLQAIEEKLQEPRQLAMFSIPKPTIRQTIEAIMSGYAKASSDYQGAWNALYSQLYLHYRIKIKSYKKEKNQSWLDIAEKINCLEQLLALAEKNFRI